MKIRRDRGTGHIVHGGIGVFWHTKRHVQTHTGPPHLSVKRSVEDIYIYTPWARWHIDLALRRRSKRSPRRTR